MRGEDDRHGRDRQPVRGSRAPQTVSRRADRNLVAIRLIAAIKSKDSTSPVIPRLMAVAKAQDELRAAIGSPLDDDSWAALTWADPGGSANIARDLLMTGQQKWGDDVMKSRPDLAEYRSLVDFVYDQRAASAVVLIARLPANERRQSDLDLIRGHLSQAPRITRDVVASALAEVAQGQDAVALLDVASDTYGLTKKKLIDAATRVARIDVIRDSMESADPQIAVAAARIYAESKGVSSKTLEALLVHQTPAVRLVIVRALIKRMRPRARRGLLDRYSAKPKYFYNVVAAIDRSLYGPVAMRDA
jgi:hypothetical protein